MNRFPVTSSTNKEDLHSPRWDKNQVCGVGGFWMESVSDSWQLWEPDFFVRLRKSNWIIFCITLLSWEFLWKWNDFFWSFCWNRGFLLCTTISIDFYSQPNFIPFVLRRRKFTSDSATLIKMHKDFFQFPHPFPVHLWEKSMLKSLLVCDEPVPG